MKKKVLFALIALFSFVSTWAAGVEVTATGGYKVTLTDPLVVINATTGEAPLPTLVAEFPVAKEGSTFEQAATDGVYDYQGKPVTKLDKVGYYLLKVTFKEKVGDAAAKAGVAYVPFTVGKNINVWRVYNEATFNQALTSNAGFLKSYYEQYPEFELWDSEADDPDVVGRKGKLVSMSHDDAIAALTEHPERYSHNYAAQLASMALNGVGAQQFPYFGFTLNDEGAYKVLVTREGKAPVWWSETNTYGKNGAKQRSFNSMAAENPLLTRLGIENGGTAFSKTNPYEGFEVKLDMRKQVEDAAHNLVTNENYGKPFKALAAGGFSGTEYANGLAEAVHEPAALLGMKLVAVPAEDAPAIATFKIPVAETDVTLVYDENDPTVDHFTYKEDGGAPVEQIATVVVTVNGVELTKDVDYALTYEGGDGAFKNPDEWDITVVNKDGSMYDFGENGIKKTEVILPARVVDDRYELDANNVTYFGTSTHLKAKGAATLTNKTTGQSVAVTNADFVAGVKFVYIGEEKATDEALANLEGEEVINPNHVGWWQMRVYVTPATGGTNTLYYVYDQFKVNQAILTLALTTVDMKYGQAYPDLGDPENAPEDGKYSVPGDAEGEGYKPGDDRNNVEIRNFGKAQPLQSYGEFIEAGQNYFYLHTGNPIAVTTIDGVEYQNYKCQVVNQQAMIRVAAGEIGIAIAEANMSKTYGFDDPEFNAVLTNADNKYVKAYSGEEKVADCVAAYIADNYSEEEAAALTDAQKAAITAGVTRELTELQKIYGYVSVERDKAGTPEGEDVGAYDFIIKVDKVADDAYAKNYNWTPAVGAKFYIEPYDLAKSYKADGSEWKEGTDDASKKIASKFVINAPNLGYQGVSVVHDNVGTTAFGTVEANKKLSVAFNHDVLGSLTLTDKATAATGTKPAVPADFVITGYENNINVSREAVTWNYQSNAVVTVTANTAATADLNGNIINSQTQKFAITPKLATIAFDEYEKEYGTDDSEAWKKGDAEKKPVNILNPTYEGLTAEDLVKATTDDGSAFWITKPVFAREAGEECGKDYAIYCVKDGEKIVGTAQNYDFTARAGKLSITKAKLEVTAVPYVLDPAEVEGGKPVKRYTGLTFGEDIQFEVRVQGYKTPKGATEPDKNLLGEDGLVPEPEGTYGTIKVSALNAGSFTWEFEGGDEELTNYYVVYYDGDGRIQAADGLIIYADNKSKTYGTLDPTLTYTAKLDGKVLTAEELDALWLEGQTKQEIRLARESATLPAGSNVGNYEIFFPGMDNTDAHKVKAGEVGVPLQIGNYNVQYKTGVLTIERATLFAKVAVVYAKDKDNNPVYDSSIAYGDVVGRYVDGAVPGYTIVENTNPVSTESGISGSGLIDGDNFDQVVNEKLQALSTETGVKKSVLDVINYVCDYDEEFAIGKFTVSTEKTTYEAKNYYVVVTPGVDVLNVEAAGLILTARNQNYDYQRDFTDDEAKAYTTPSINKEISDVTIKITYDGAVINEAQLPGGVKLTDLVSSINCDITAAGEHKGAITLTKKENSKIDATVVAGDLKIAPLADMHLAYDNVAQALEDHKGFEMEKVYMPARQMKADQWYTFVLPFEFTVPEFARTFYYGVVDVLDEEAADGDFHFNLTINDVEANQPFLFKVAENPEFPADDQGGYAVTREQMEEIFFEDKTIADVEEGGVFFAYNDLEKSPFRADAAGNKITGQYTGVAKGVLTDLDRIMSNGIFGKASATATLKPTVAYISYPDATAAANGRVFVQEPGGFTTEISGVDAEADAEFAEGWYTITGINVSPDPVSGHG